MQLLGAAIAQKEKENKQLRIDNSIQKETIVDLAKSESEEPIVEQVVTKVKAYLNKR